MLPDFHKYLYSHSPGWKGMGEVQLEGFLSWNHQWWRPAPNSMMYFIVLQM